MPALIYSSKANWISDRTLFNGSEEDLFSSLLLMRRLKRLLRIPMWEQLRRNQPWCRFQFWTWPLGQRLFLQVALTPCFHLQGTAREANQEIETPQNSSKDVGYCLNRAAWGTVASSQLGCPLSFSSVKLWIVTWKDFPVCWSVKDWNKGLLSHRHRAPCSLIEY